MPTQLIQPIPFPLIQGVLTDHSSLDVRFDGKTGPADGASLWKYGLKSFSWNAALEPGEARGASAQVTGLTRGQLKASGSMEWIQAYADQLELMLQSSRIGQGMLEWTFLVELNYIQESVSIQPSSFAAYCRMTKIDQSSTAGNEAHATKYDLYILAGTKNGIPLITGQIMPGVIF